MSEGIELRFWAAVHTIETGEERRLAIFYIMNTSLNLNNWRVTDEALEQALPTLLGKPLGCIPGYRVNHVHQPLIVGRFIRVEKPDGYALATAEITDPTAWEKLQSGEWGPVSVVIKAYRVRCSLCGADITSGPDEHVLGGEAHEIVESFVFDRVDFVSQPAYPQAGVIALGLGQSRGGSPSSASTARKGGEMQKAVSLVAGVVPFEETPKAPEDRAWDADAAEQRIRRWAGGPDKENIDWAKYRRAFAWYDASDPENFGSYKLPHHDVIDGRLHVVWRGVAAAMQVLLGARGGVDIPEEDRRAVYNHLARHYRQFGREPPAYHASRSTPSPGVDEKEEEERREMEERIAELEAEVESLRRENEELRAKLAAMEEERHMELVNAVVEARMRAGLVKNRQAEMERLRILDDETLKLLKEDAEKLASKMSKTESVPKAKYTAESVDALKEAIEETRMRLFGYRRDE